MFKILFNMKTSKPTLKKSGEDKCGVWLDTSELKGKAKQKRPARPISKLLNPFLEGGGYSVAVALNFTQTKLEIPKTKQSSISSFFAPKPKEVVKEMPTSEDAVTPTASAWDAPSPATRGTKRSRDMDLDTESERARVRNLERENVVEEEAWEEQSENHTPAENKHFGMIRSSRSERRVSAKSSLLDDDEHLLRAWSQDPLFTCSELSQGESCRNDQSNSTTEDVGPSASRFSNDLQSEDAWGVCLDGADTTSTQKPLKNICSSLLDDDKENSEFAPHKSPNEHLTSNLKRARSPSPRKCIPVRPREEGCEEESQFAWTKPRSSPVKRARLSWKDVDEDNLAMLFTQDSEGFKVIAHGSTRGRSPLKDRSNIHAGTPRKSVRISLEEEEDEEMLFTQDSQGNVVIKH